MDAVLCELDKGTYAVLFPCVVGQACIMRMSTLVFYILFIRTPLSRLSACVCRYMDLFFEFAFVAICCLCVHEACGFDVAFDSAACVFSLTQPKGMSSPEKG